MTNNKEKHSIQELIEIIELLRDPNDGCPWNIAQTHKSLIPYVIEEAYEVIDAIRSKQPINIKEELGDLLLQIILHSRIASEKNDFDFNDVVTSLKEKLIRRHPHVFSGKKVNSIEDVNQIWESIKQEEKEQRNSYYVQSPICNELKNKNRYMPPMASALSISTKAAKAGLEWETINDLWAKFNEELKEVKEAIKSKNQLEIEAELGDLFFTLINIARWFKVNPEESIAGTNERFLNRLAYIENKTEGKLSIQSKKDLNSMWKSAKNKVG